ncbi:hypothetical protein N752_10045 [Desulforamulus aquiferis]|nr:hypothetical protein [Desulforamulus aquiferis]RYD05305.1 hypothetical protein N752_10045 [Desulforamulus aquiferis]
MLGFELAETVRGLPKVKRGGVVLANTENIFLYRFPWVYQSIIR